MVCGQLSPDETMSPSSPSFASSFETSPTLDSVPLLLRFLSLLSVNCISIPLYCLLSLLTSLSPPDLYSPIMGQSPLIDDLFGKLQKKVNDELRMQRDVLVGLKGMVDMVLGNAIMGQIEASLPSPVVV